MYATLSLLKLETCLLEKGMLFPFHLTESLHLLGTYSPLTSPPVSVLSILQPLFIHALSPKSPFRGNSKTIIRIWKTTTILHRTQVNTFSNAELFSYREIRFADEEGKEPLERKESEASVASESFSRSIDERADMVAYREDLVWSGILLRFEATLMGKKPVLIVKIEE